MSTLSPSPDQHTEACAVDRSCADSGCGCSTPDRSAPAATTSRTGFKAGLLAAACAIACLAVPFAMGGVAAVSGAVAGEWWLLVGLAVAAIIIGAAAVRRHRSGKLC